MKIMTVSDSPALNSGLARVHRNVLDGFIDAGHEVFPCVWFGYNSQEIERIKKGEKVKEIFYRNRKLFAIPKASQTGMMAVAEAAEDLKPDLILTIGDYWDFFYMKSLKTRMNYSFKWICYTTIEEADIDSKWNPLFQHMDGIATPTLFGVESLGKIGFHAQYIPYGVDDVFKPLDPEKRTELRKEKNISEKIRFITVAQNTVRKNLPSIFFGFKELLDRNENLAKHMSFHIHTNLTARDAQETYIYDLLRLGEKLNILDYFSFPMADTSVFSKIAPKDTDLVEEYGVSDFCLLPSSSEGFGLPLIEAMACGVPCVGSHNTGITEHVSGRGILIDTRKEIYPPCFIVNSVDCYTVSRALERAATIFGSEKYKNMSEEGLRYVSNFKWKGMSDKILELIKEMKNGVSIPIEVV